MLQTFKVQNVKCDGCAATLKSKLEPVFGPIEVDLEKEPREITLDIDAEKIDVLGDRLRTLGYPFVGEALGFIENTSVKAKSFVSCAIGKMNA